MEKKNEHRSNAQRKLDNRRNYIIGRNPEEQHKRTRSLEGIGKERWSSMER